MADSDDASESSEGEEIYEMPATRDAILRDIAECDTLDTAKAMMRALLDTVLRTDLAPPLKQVTAQRKVEIRFWHDATEEEDGELQCEEFDAEEVRVQRMEDKFNIDGLAESSWPWLEAVGWRDAPWSEAAAEPPLILFPDGLPPRRDKHGELKEHVESPFVFDLTKSGGTSYFLRTGVSCRGKLFAGLRSISRPPVHTGDTDDEAERMEREAAQGSLALSAGALKSLEPDADE